MNILLRSKLYIITYLFANMYLIIAIKKYSCKENL